MQIHLRPVVESDISFLRQLNRLRRWAEFAPLPWTDAAKEALIDNQFDLQQRHYTAYYTDAEFLLVLRHDRPIGRLTIERTADDVCLMDIALLPDCCGQGIGSLLLRRLQHEAGATVTLHVDPSNPARRLYARLGFVERPEDEPTASLTMVWRRS